MDKLETWLFIYTGALSIRFHPKNHPNPTFEDIDLETGLAAYIADEALKHWEARKCHGFQESSGESPKGSECGANNEDSSKPMKLMRLSTMQTSTPPGNDRDGLRASAPTNQNSHATGALNK